MRLRPQRLGGIASTALLLQKLLQMPIMLTSMSTWKFTSCLTIARYQGIGGYTSLANGLQHLWSNCSSNSWLVDLTQNPHGTFTRECKCAGPSESSSFTAQSRRWFGKDWQADFIIKSPFFSERKLSSKGRISLRCRFCSEKRHMFLRDAAIILYLFTSRYAILLSLLTVIDMYDHLQQGKKATDDPCEVIIWF